MTSVADDVDQVLEEEEEESGLDELAQDDVILAEDDVAAHDDGLEAPEDDRAADGVHANVTTARAEDGDAPENEDDGTEVEAGLDVILRERVDGAGHQEDGLSTVEAANLSETTVLPKQPGEFVCGSCFLVKQHSQLADQERRRCCDCVR